MQAKVLFIGDPHFKINNIEIVEVFIQQCLAHIRRERPDLCIIAGDVLHTHERLHTTAYNKALEFIGAVRQLTRTVVLVGNHDYENNQQFQTNKHWMNALKEWNNITIVDKSCTLSLNGCCFICVPYIPPGRFIEALNTLEDGWRGADCIFAHQEFFGCKMGAITSTDGDKWENNYPLVVSGHIHSEQQPQENIYYPGSVLQHAFGESENNGLLVLDFTAGVRPIMRKIVLDIPRMRTVYVDICKFSALELAPVTNERVKVVCRGGVEEFKALKKTKHYKSLIEKGVKIHFKFSMSSVTPARSVVSELRSFSEILETLIDRESEPVNNLYRELVGGKCIRMGENGREWERIEWISPEVGGKLNKSEKF